MRPATAHNGGGDKVPILQPHRLTWHAQTRLTARSLSHETISAAMTFGRSIRIRGAEIYVIGRKEVEHYRHQGIDLSPFEGIQLVCSRDGAVITIYRNRDFRGLRPHRRPRWRCSKWTRMPHHAA
jgi:hypothetical protein